MTEEKKPEQKTVPLATLTTERTKWKAREKELNDKIDNLSKEVSDLRNTNTDLFAGLKTTDEEEKNVKQQLIDIESKLRDKAKALDERERTLDKREGEFNSSKDEFEGRKQSTELKEKAAQFQISEEALREAIENGETENEALLRLVAEKTTETPGTPGGGYDRPGPAGTPTAKMPADMNDEEFEQYLDQQRREAAART